MSLRHACALSSVNIYRRNETVEMRTCQHCGKEFWGRPNRRYCSIACAYKAYVKRFLARGKKPAIFAARECPICGRTFTPKVINQKTCGKPECHAEWMRRRYRRDK